MERKFIDHSTGEVRQDELGREIPDRTPLELPIGAKRPETLAEQVQRLVRNQVSQYAAMHGHETFADADDFDIDDDVDPTTPYEVEFDPVLGRDLTPADFMDPEKRAWLREQYLIAERNAIRAEARQEAIDEAYKAAKRPKREAAEGAAPSSSGPARPAGGPSARPPAEPRDDG